MSYQTPVIDSSGTIFASQRAAARAHGVDRMTIQYHLNTHGSLDRLGRGNSRPRCQNAAKATRIGPHSFPSRIAAAEWLGVSVWQLNRWMHPDAHPNLRDRLLAAVMIASTAAKAPVASGVLRSGQRLCAEGAQ